MRNIAMVVSYDGTEYHGFQFQPGLKTVESELKSAISSVVNHDVKIVAAARTDAGVHALGQVINFRTSSEIPVENILKGVNTYLPSDIRILKCMEVEPRFNSRKSTKSKSYLYLIFNGPVINPFIFRYSWHIPYDLDISLMDKVALQLVGTRDFSAFKKKDEIYRSTVREILRARVKRRKNLVFFLIEGKSFMRYMVRTIVGTLVQVGLGKMSPQQFFDVLESKDRSLAGPTAPSKGLFLKEITYENYDLTPRIHIFTST